MAEECAVCFERIGTEVTLLPCRHHFCQSCIGEWLTRATTCPVCQTTVFGSCGGSMRYLHPFAEARVTTQTHGARHFVTEVHGTSVVRAGDEVLQPLDIQCSGEGALGRVIWSGRLRRVRVPCGAISSEPHRRGLRRVTRSSLPATLPIGSVVEQADESTTGCLERWRDACLSCAGRSQTYTVVLHPPT